MTAQMDMLLPEIPGRSLAAQANACESLKRLALDKVESKGQAWLRVMRDQAVILCRRDGCVTTDELRLYAEHSLQYPHHENCWGAIFRGPRWRIIGRRKSRWASTHSREIKVWQYVESRNA